MSNWPIEIQAVNPDGTITIDFNDYIRIIANQPFSYTAAQIADKDERVNTVDKRVGKMIWDTTNSLAYWATGTGQTDDWKTWSGTITPS